MADTKRDATYGDEAAVRHINAAADGLKAVIIRNVADADSRKEAIALVIQAQVRAFAAIMA